MAKSFMANGQSVPHHFTFVIGPQSQQSNLSQNLYEWKTEILISLRH
jgi:hypothetical protein